MKAQMPRPYWLELLGVPVGALAGGTRTEVIMGLSYTRPTRTKETLALARRGHEHAVSSLAGVTVHPEILPSTGAPEREETPLRQRRGPRDLAEKAEVAPPLSPEEITRAYQQIEDLVRTVSPRYREQVREEALTLLFFPAAGTAEPPNLDTRVKRAVWTADNRIRKQGIGKLE